MRTWWQRNDKALGVIIGSALLTVLGGAGGLTGLAKLVGLATGAELAEVKKDMAAVVKAQQIAAEVDAANVAALNKKLDVIAKDAKAARAAVLPRGKKKPPTEGSPSE